MAFWPYMPDGTMEESLTAVVGANDLGGQALLVNRQQSVQVRAFRLRYSLVTSADAAGMWDFYTARRGAFEAFDFLSPNDQRVYQVRFTQDGLTRALFQPGFFALGGELVFTVVAS